MRILYNNILKNYSTITATYESANRPVTNLLHNYLELPFQATLDGSLIEIILDQDYPVNCFACGFHNMYLMTVDIYDVSNNFLWGGSYYDGSVEGPLGDTETMHYFPIQSDARKIYLGCETHDTNLIIGGFSMGVYLDMPDFLQGPKQNISLRDSIYESGSGQSGGNKQRNLEDFTLSFLDVSNSKREEIKTYLRTVQRSVPHYVDRYPDSQDEVPPMYCKVISDTVPNDKRVMRDFTYDFNITWKEAR